MVASMNTGRHDFLTKMIWIALAILAVALSIWGAARPAAGADTAEEFPVWWSPKLELGSLENLPRRMDRDFPPERWRVVGIPDDGEKTIIDDCKSLLSSGFDLPSWFYGVDSEARPFYSELADCQALSRLGQVRPAKVSHLQTFELGPQAPKILPNLFVDYRVRGYDGSLPCEMLCDVELVLPDGESWADAAPSPLIETDSPENMVLWSNGRGIRVFVLARGDFNIDGIEDVLIKRHFLSGGLYDDVLILTRFGPDSIIRALSPGELCLAPDGASLCSEQ